MYDYKFYLNLLRKSSKERDGMLWYWEYVPEKSYKDEEPTVSLSRSYDSTAKTLNTKMWVPYHVNGMLMNAFGYSKPFFNYQSL